VKAGLVKHPEDWMYSSYRDYIGLRTGTLPIPGVIMEQFRSKMEYASFVMENDDKEIHAMIIYCWTELRSQDFSRNPGFYRW
jgi:hypothetical protein